MKKSFIFASLVAMVAMLAVSCQPKVDAPKARFTYAADGLTVSFTNASKDADAYAWDFGDNTAVSEEKDPVHTYAEAGTYTVKLTAKNAGGENSMSQTIELAAAAFSIKIDGDFADWATVPADVLAEAKVDENATLEELKDIKFCANADYIYFYMEYNGEEGVVGVLDIFINTDDDANTGHASWLWLDSGADILFEGGTDVDAESGAELWYPEMFTSLEAGTSDWLWDTTDAAGAISLSEIKMLANGNKAIEGSIMRASIPNLKSCKVGCLVQGPGWTGEAGALPETAVSEEDGSSIVSPMMEVKLP